MALPVRCGTKLNPMAIDYVSLQWMYAPWLLFVFCHAVLAAPVVVCGCQCLFDVFVAGSVSLSASRLDGPLECSSIPCQHCYCENCSNFFSHFS
jgi:hypothetical protein